MALPAHVPLRNGRRAVLRRATPEDAEAWRANVNAVGAEGVLIMTETVRRTVDEIRHLFEAADPRQELWLVAELDGTLVGGADFRRGAYSKNAHVAELGVAILKAYRRLGLGEALIRAGIEWARGVGVTRLRLGVFETNRGAVALYRKLGFVEVGRLKGEVVLEGTPTDEILMALSLG